MKIIKRHNYKMKNDQLIAVGLSELMANIFCKQLNDNKVNEFDNYFFQVVSDNFEIKDKE